MRCFYFKSIRVLVLSFVLLDIPFAYSAQDPAVVYPAALNQTIEQHRAVAQTCYRLLADLDPAIALLRLQLSNFTGSASLRIEWPLDARLPSRSTSWVQEKQVHGCPAERTKWQFDPASGALSAAFTVTLPSGFESGPARRKAADALADRLPSMEETVTVTIEGTIREGRFDGNYVCEAAGTRGQPEGSVLTVSTALNDYNVRHLPAYGSKELTPHEQYALAAGLERDTVLTYGLIRALAASAGNLDKLTEFYKFSEIPVPVRPPFIPLNEVAKAEPPSTPPASKAPRRGKALPAASAPDLSDLMGLEEKKKSEPVQSQEPAVTQYEAIQKGLLQMEAIKALTTHLAACAKRLQSVKAGKSEDRIQRGLQFEDPLFGPWYGTAALVLPNGSGNRLPDKIDASGVQDWPYLQAWQFLGPFDHLAANWDPVLLPDGYPVANTEFRGKDDALVTWRAATTNAAGCAIFTDLNIGETVADAEIEQEPVSPRPRHFKSVLYFAATTLDAPRDMQLLLAAGCSGYLSVWINDVLVARGPQNDDPGDLTQEALLFKAELKAGTNRIFVRCETEAYSLFTHRRPGMASFFWMRACTQGASSDPRRSQAWLEKVALKKKTLPNLPENVRGYRHDQTGHFAEAESVTAWDIDRGINVRWCAPIEQWSKASPLVVGDKVFVCAEPHVLLCLDALSGDVLWRQSANVLELLEPAAFAASEKLHQAFLEARAELAPRLKAIGPDYAARLRKLAQEKPELPQVVADLRAMEGEVHKKYRAFLDHFRTHAKPVAPGWDGHYSGPWLGYTFATPITDGTRIFVQFRTGVCAAFDLNGKRLWMTHTPYSAGGIAVCSSPVLAGDKLVISQPTDSGRSGAPTILTAFDINTGVVSWRTQAHSQGQLPSPLTMRLTDGEDDMYVVVTDGGTVVRAADGKVLVTGLRGGSGTATPTAVDDLLYRIELAQGGAVQLLMLNKDTVGARWKWFCGGRYNAMYAGVGYHNGILFGTAHGGSQSVAGRGLELFDANTGEPLERPFNLQEREKKLGIFNYPRYGFIPPVSSKTALYLAVRGQGHASSLREELPNKWSPYTYISVVAPGGYGRFIAHNKVVAPMTPHLALAGDRVYLRNDQELICFGYTRAEGRAYEAEVNASTILADLTEEIPTEPAAEKLWRAGIEAARPYLERVVALKPESDTARRAKIILNNK